MLLPGYDLMSADMGKPYLEPRGLLRGAYNDYAVGFVLGTSEGLTNRNCPLIRVIHHLHTALPPGHREQAGTNLILLVFTSR